MTWHLNKVTIIIIIIITIIIIIIIIIIISELLEVMVLMTIFVILLRIKHRKLTSSFGIPGNTRFPVYVLLLDDSKRLGEVSKYFTRVQKRPG